MPFFPVAASTLAGEVDALYVYLLAVTVLFSTLIFVFLAVFAIRYRRRPGVEAEQVEGSLALEIGWSVMPLGFLMVMFVWGAKLYFAQLEPPPDAMPVTVVGKQWMWKVQHPEGRREINQLHVPLGRPVRLLLASEDVIHSFFIPAFRVKMDAVPGRVTQLWFEPTRAGTYHLFCAEYCGTQHSGMIGQVVVLEPHAYERWLAEAAPGQPPSEPPVKAGARLFREHGCSACHRDRADERGPALAGLLGRRVALQGGGTVIADESYVRESILRPGAKVAAGWAPSMPAFAGRLDEERVLQLVAYLGSLDPRAGTAPADGAR